MPNSLVAKWLARTLAAAGLVTVGDSTVATDTTEVSTDVGSTTETTTPPVPEETSSGAKAMKVGMNLAAPVYWTPTREFMNLTWTDTWRVQTKTADSTDSYYDSDGNIIKYQSGDNIYRLLSMPDAIYTGKSVDIVCRWDGSGTVRVTAKANIANLANGANGARFTITGDPGTRVQLKLFAVDASNPVRNLDCREAGADPNKLFADNFISNTRRFSSIRFMDWMDTNGNNPVTWATRTRAVGPGRSIGPDKVPVEYMIQLANETDADPWFCMPYNADDDYIRKFAQMVLQKLNSNRKIYVELSNEVWNPGFAATKQAKTEGLAEGLATTDEHLATLLRYAEKTGHVMDIWTDVFKGHEDRLVRVLASQAGSWGFKQMMAFRDTPSKIDALAIAPYFALNLDKNPADVSDLTPTFDLLKSTIDERLGTAASSKGVADQYGKRLVTYEAGQHITGKDLAAQDAIQRDPRMGQLYTYYLQQWQQKFGDTMHLFLDVGEISNYGAWGLLENAAQAPDATVKSKAVWLFQASLTK